MIWGLLLFLSATKEAAAPLGQYYQENLRTTKNTDFDKIKPLFDITQKWMLDQEHEIHGKSKIDWGTILCVRSTLLNDKAIKPSTAKVYVFSDSVRCLGRRIAEYPRSVVSWKDRIVWFTQSPEYRELDNIDGEPVSS